ncbi:hypothetical protein [Alteromonas sp. H39]|uniref:hypothetical protein n=1 Tax=Alteromonas sp. H39 TaxID=3389876 RepID=UPI0039E0D51F
MAKMISTLLQRTTFNSTTAFTVGERMTCNYPDNYYGDQICVSCPQPAKDD